MPAQQELLADFLAERTCLKPVSFKPLLGVLARRLTSDASVVKLAASTLKASTKELTTREPSTHSG